MKQSGSYLSIKGLMYDYFITQTQLTAYQAVLVFDDNEHELEGIKQSKSAQQKDKVLTLVKVDAKDFTKQYTKEINGHLASIKPRQLSLGPQRKHFGFPLGIFAKSLSSLTHRPL